MAKNNMDLRVKMLEVDASQKKIAEVLGVRRDYLSRRLSEDHLAETFRARILAAIQQIEKQQKVKS